ncbi:hypothetical protein Ciccas_003771 [Cichlidogyrus casuarinus]|uniref:Uncharacterized protein n=1 Tax=Cichlidogyrus casuarinus TaxID=1844966 RepID=A0ABD2QEA8_9PLAT
MNLQIDSNLNVLETISLNIVDNPDDAIGRFKELLIHLSEQKWFSKLSSREALMIKSTAERMNLEQYCEGLNIEPGMESSIAKPKGKFPIKN